MLETNCVGNLFTLTSDINIRKISSTLKFSHSHGNSVTNIHKLRPQIYHQLHVTNIKISPTSLSSSDLDLGWHLSPTSEIATSNFLSPTYVTIRFHDSSHLSQVCSHFCFILQSFHNDVDLIFGDTLRSWNTSLWLRDGGCWWRKSRNLSSISKTGHLKSKKLYKGIFLCDHWLNL